ncbi:MAG: MCP four helix bundle domain-containing protein, partial [Tepidimonas sp.]
MAIRDWKIGTRQALGFGTVLVLLVAVLLLGLWSSVRMERAAAHAAELEKLALVAEKWAAMASKQVVRTEAAARFGADNPEIFEYFQRQIAATRVRVDELQKLVEEGIGASGQAEQLARVKALRQQQIAVRDEMLAALKAGDGARVEQLLSTRFQPAAKSYTDAQAALTESLAQEAESTIAQA